MSIFVVAGEKSGDAIAAKVLKPLAKITIIEGVLGPKLKELGAKELFSIESFQVMGFVDVIKALPHFILLFHKIKKAILQKNPKLVLLVDNAEFSLLLAKSLRKSGFSGKIVQLVCPSIWAWRKGRIKTLEENFDLVLSILPFEKNYFKNSPLPVEYIGHPLFEELAKEKTSDLTLPHDKPIIAIFPGSRKKETLLNLPLQLAAVKDLSSHHIAIGVASNHLMPLIQTILQKSGVTATLVLPENRFELMKRAQFALSKLGTINLELAFFEVPTITSFPLPLVEKFLLQYLFKVFLPHYSIVNLLAERRIFPEYIASFATLENLKREVFNFATHAELRAWTIAGCQDVKKLLETHSFITKAPQILSKVLLDI